MLTVLLGMVIAALIAFGMRNFRSKPARAGRHARYRGPHMMRRGLVPLLALLCLILSQVTTVGPAASVHVAHAAGTPTITTVSFAGTGGLNGSVTVTISGQSFGTEPPAIPDNVAGSPVFDGYSGQNFGSALQLAFTDNATTAPAPWSAGQSGNHIGLVLSASQYTDTSVVFGFGNAYGPTFPGGYYLNAGDPFTVYVGGQPCSGIVSFSTPTSCAPPIINTVTFGGSSASPSITLNGSGFGSTLPAPTVTGAAGYTGNDYTCGVLAISYAGTDAGQAGPLGNNYTCPTDNTVHYDYLGLFVSTYSDALVQFTLGSYYSQTAGLFPGTQFTVTVAGVTCSGQVSYSAPVSCIAPPPPAPSLTLAETHPGTSAGTFGTTIFGQLSGAVASTSYTLNFYSASSCGAQPGTLVGTAPVTTDGSGNASFSPTLQGSLNTAGTQIAVTATSPASAVSALSPCIAAVQGNDSWDTALQLWPDSAAGSQSVPVAQSIYTKGEERWYDFPVQPGAEVHIHFDGPAGSVVSLHTDIRQLYNALSNPSTATKVAGDLAIKDAPSGYLPSGYLPSGYLPSGYLPSGYLPSGYLPSGYLPSGYLPSGYLPSGYLPSGYLPSGYLPSGYLPSGYLPSGYLPSGYLPSGYLPSGYLPGAYASVPRQSLMAIATNATASTLNIDRNTWDLTGHLYVRVAGPVGAFTLTVGEAGGVCGGITPVSGTNGTLPTATVNGVSPQSLILWDSTRWDSTHSGNSSTDVSTLQSKMTAFAGRTDVNGQIIDLSQFARVVNANSQADSNAACPAAKNLVASEIKSIVQGYRDAYQSNGKTTVKYMVLVGDDHFIPFFRYPDESGLAPENGYVPPASDTSATQASLRNNYVLGQDEYGASTSIPRGDHSMPIPDLAVGRLVDTAAEASHMLDAYTAANGVITPGSALVTGYDFVAGAATSASNELSAGINPAGCSATSSCVTPDQLIAPQGAASTSPLIWTADNLRQKLYGTRHDIVFLAGHFSAANLLASDYSTQLSAAEVVSSTASLSNTLVLALGCHGGLNLPGQDSIAGVSPTPDWTEAMAMKGATFLAATGYAYGDTVLTEYGARLFVNVARQLRTGTGNVPIGVANVAAKQDYLNTHLDLGGIDEKTLLETTLYGLPMLQVNMRGQRLTASTSSSIVSSAPTVTTGPGAGLGLAVGQNAIGSPDIAVAPTTTMNTTPLTDTSGNPVTASWLSGASGVVAHPLDPVFPLQLYNATVPNQVLRGIGFRSGSFTDLPNVTPLTVAPSTETSVGHPTFFSNVFYPTQVWSANYFDTVDGLNGGITNLAVAPAQYQSSSPGSTAGTIRKFTDLKFRLYYLGNSALASQITTGAALDSAPNIVGATSTRDSSGNVTFQVRVQNGLLPSGVQDLQDVWVTYTDPSSGTPQWTSVDLTQDVSDPSLWTGTASGLSSGTVFMVQAANATGLVSLNTNNGAYFTIAPATPPPPPVAPVLTIQSASNSGVYQSSATFTVSLQANSAGIPNQPVAVQVGPQTKYVTTGSDGTATVTIPLALAPGSYTVNASYAGATVGGTTYSGAAGHGNDFTINPAPTTLTLTPSSANATYSSSESNGIAAALQSNGAGLAQKSVYFTIDNGAGGLTHRVTITDANGNAALGTLSLPAGSYTVSAAFAKSISDPAVAYTDPYYQGSSTTAPASLTIAKASQTITFGALANATYGNADFSVSATGGGSGNPVTFTASPSTDCTAIGTNGATIHIAAAGPCTVTAAQAGNSNYTAATSVPQSFTINQASQTITFGSLSNHLLGEAPFTVTASGGGSNNLITFSAGPGSVCTSSGANGSSITLAGVGTCTVTANQLGNANYLTAGPVTQSFTVAYPPLYLAMTVTSSPAGPVTTGSTISASVLLGNHTTSTQTVTTTATLTYTGSHGSQTVSRTVKFKLNAGQTVSDTDSFPISSSFPRGTYLLTLTAKDGSGHAATRSATLTVV